MNKYFLPLVLFIFLAGTINAQPWMDKFSDPDNVDFKLKQKAFYEYWQKKDPSALGKFLESIRKKERTKDEDEKPGYKQFKRWEDFMSQRLPNGGFIPTDRATFDALNRDRTASRAGSGSNSVQSVATWEAIGPFGKPSGGGAGRVNVLVSDPSNASILYAGTPAGGLWKSTNGGTTWFSVNGLYSNMGVSAIAVDATNPNTIYIGTGDKDGDDTYSFGVLKTTDGGATWVLTSLNYTISQKRQINCLLVHPTKPNIVIASTSSGLMRSVDGGLNWFTEKTGAWNDLEFMPNNPDVIYVTNTGKVYKSVDAGDNWVLASTNLNTTGGNRLELAVTAANPNIIYAVASQSSDNGFLAFYKSSNGGATWKTAYNNTNKNLLGWDPDGGDSGGQGWYDLSIQAAPNDSNKVFVGGVNIWRTTNGGSTFTLNAHWYGGGGKPYVHADHHAMIAIPGTTTFLAGCDGGVFRTTNGGTAWSDVSNTMNIQQYYKY